MVRRVVWPLVFGIGGVAILVSLGVWQVQRLGWKAGVLAEIEARIGDAPAALPAVPDPEADRYLPVDVTGRLGGDPLRVLVSQRGIGAGYRIIAPMDVAGRVVMVDLGVSAPDAVLPELEGAVQVVGNLHWPQEVDGFTPDPDLLRNIWYARDVDAMAAALGTEPVFVIAREVSPAPEGIVPLPVDTSDIPNDHLNYAITWFSLAALWMGMTLYLLWRIRRRTV